MRLTEAQTRIGISSLKLQSAADVTVNRTQDRQILTVGQIPQPVLETSGSVVARNDESNGTPTGRKCRSPFRKTTNDIPLVVGWQLN
ncbi:MAG: hypothetical protein B7X34_09810 [Acidobacteriia bacterium 12-62-4]|nr:MAG: hypothetical protein B7X34_09810 [Acidobacteriia bacterium 12-62-4]